MEQNLLSVEDLSVSYGKINVLKGISLSLAKGEIVAIIGANGAGKTTLVNALSGIVPARGGRTLFKGEDITRLPAYRIARKGIVQIPEGRKVFPDMSVAENLEIGASPEDKASAVQALMEEMFTLFPVLKERRSQKAGTLSGGEQQMLAIGRGLMASPELLMFDEPSMGLAPTVVSKVFQVIRDIHARGITVLLIEQNARKALQIADRAYVLETGRIVLSGAGLSLLENEKVRKAYLGK
jgi:branched-chain amino acid transport system ATP-binding protein